MTRQIILRQETEEDFDEIYEVNQLAFGQDNEADLVNALRKMKLLLYLNFHL